MADQPKFCPFWAKPKILELRVSEEGYILNESYNVSFAVAYRGMTNGTFALSDVGRDSVNNFFPSNSREIYYDGSQLKVIEVNPEKIILEYLGKETENKK